MLLQHLFVCFLVVHQIGKTLEIIPCNDTQNLFCIANKHGTGNQLRTRTFATFLQMATTEQPQTTSDAAMARKHRIAMRNRQRSVSSSSSDEETPGEAKSNKRQRLALEAEPVTVSSSSVLEVSETSKATPKQILESIRKKKPHITGIKKQSRYDPGVAMTKEELKAWRKEARRVRNRESAAASRKKNREAIDRLEIQVKEVQSKYDAALRYILALEEQLGRPGSSSSSSFFPSEVLRQDLDDVRKLPPQGVEATKQMFSPSQSPGLTELPREVNTIQGQRSWPVKVQNNHDEISRSHPFSSYHPNHSSTLNSQMHIIDNTIIRPIACV